MVVKVAFLGIGNIGSGVYQLLSKGGEDIENRHGLCFEVVRALVRDKAKKRGLALPQGLLTEDFNDILNDPTITMVVEYMGGINPAFGYLQALLRAGKTVVTANKDVVANYWPELEVAAQEGRAGLYFEASVCGGIPIINTLGNAMQANRIQKLLGIINGTTNYILTKMSSEGSTYERALKEAQAQGLAEPNPESDVEAWDAVYKLSILASMAFHQRIPLEAIFREGIAKITPEDIQYGKELGYALKLIAMGKRAGDNVEVRVHPTFIPESHPLAGVRGSYNAVFLEGDAVGNLMFFGRGAGDMPTASSIISDMVTAATSSKHAYSTFENHRKDNTTEGILDDWESEYFLRVIAHDRPGVLAAICKALAKYNVSLTAVIQKAHNLPEVPMIFITHMTRESAMNQAIEDIRALPEVVAIGNLIRVESGEIDL